MYCVIVKSVKSLSNQAQHTCDFTINNQSYPEGEIGRQHKQGAFGCRLSPYVILPHPSRPIHPKTRSQHAPGTSSPSLYEQWLWDGTHGLSSLSEKTRKSNHLQMSLQRQHFLLRYWKTLSVGPAGVRHGSPVLYQLSWPVGGIECCIVSLNFWWGRHTKVPLVKALSDSYLRDLFSPGQVSLTLHSRDNVSAE